MDSKSRIRDKSEICKDIERLVQSPGYIYAISNLVLLEQFVPIDEATEVNWKERLSFQELTYLSGLLAKETIDLRMPTEKEMSTYVKKTHKLLDDLHWAYNAPMMEQVKDMVQNKEKYRENEQLFLSNTNMMVEAIFYSGTGAFDFQYANFSKIKYEKDKKWLLENKNFEVEKANEIVFYLKELFHKKIKKNFKNIKSSSMFSKSTLEVLSFTRDELLSKFTQQQISDFLDCFSVSPGDVNQQFILPTEHNVIEYQPIISLGDGRHFIPVTFNLFRSVYESPFYWMSQDKSYFNSASQNKGEATEKIATTMLKNVFGKENVFINISVGKNKNKLISEIDTIAMQGNKAVLVQAKSKKLSLLSRGGDAESLEFDFKEAVQKAYDQGLACKKAILSKDNRFFDKDKKEIRLSENIEDVYILCLTSDYHSSIQHQARAFLKKEKDDPYPIPLSIFDLELLCHYLKDPYEFLYYLRQRINLTDYFIADEEIVYLGFHLKYKLFKKKTYDHEALDNSFGQALEVDFCVQNGIFPKYDVKEKLYSKWKNEKFELLIKQVKSSQEVGFTDAIFYLYDLAGEVADDLISRMEQTIKKAIADGQNHDFSFIVDDGDSGISFACKSKKQFRNELFDLCLARKYKTKANRWLGLGKFIGSNNMIDCIAYSQEPWKYDVSLERFAQVALKPGTAINMKKIGRNEKCPCGSNRKYKKCCGR